MTKPDINTKSTALLVMHCQVTIMNLLIPSERMKVLNNLIKVVETARNRDIPVIYVTVQFRTGYPEVSPNNILVNLPATSGELLETDPDTMICDEIRPKSGEIIVTNKRSSAFTGSDLQVVLRSKDIDTLVLTGVSSLGVVESTARAALDMDYRLFVIGDCCSAPDPHDNELAVTWLLPHNGFITVCSTYDFISSIS